MRVTAADVLVPEIVPAQSPSLNAITEVFERVGLELERTKMAVDRLKTLSFKDSNELFWEVKRIQKKLDVIFNTLNEVQKIQEEWDEQEFQQEQSTWQKGNV